MHRRTLLRMSENRPRRPGLPRLPHALPIDLARVAEWYHAFSDPTRLEILEYVSHRQRCVLELHNILGAPQSRVSFHLKVLRNAELIREHRDGRRAYYSLRPETCEHMIAFLQLVSTAQHRDICLLTCSR